MECAAQDQSDRANAALTDDLYLPARAVWNDTASRRCRFIVGSEPPGAEVALAATMTHASEWPVRSDKK